MQLPLEDKDRAAAQMGVSGSLRESARNTGRQASQKGCLTGGWTGPPVIHKQREAPPSFPLCPPLQAEAIPHPTSPLEDGVGANRIPRTRKTMHASLAVSGHSGGAREMVSLQHKHD